MSLSILQIKLKKPQSELDNFYILGEAIDTLELALAETILYVGQTNDRESNIKLASLWENASKVLKELAIVLILQT